MQTKLFQRLVLLLFCVSLPCWAYPTLPTEGLSISSMIDMSVLAFTGAVVEMEFVFRENLPPQFTTDITIEIEAMIKGTPNAGENRVKFMIPGGEGVYPTTGESLICVVPDAPKFGIGDKVFIFLRKHKRLARLPVPHGGLITGWWGKREIVDEKVSVPYTFQKRLFENGQWRDKTQMRDIHLPIDLARQIAQAALQNAEAVSTVEEQIRTFAKNAPVVPGENPMPGQVLLDSVEAAITPILPQERMEEQ